jgi:RPA family protein
MTTDSFVRHTAQKVLVSDLIQGSFVNENEQNMNYLLTTTNQKIHRLNLMAIVVHKEEIGTMTNFIIEDGSGKITIRLFEQMKQEINIGSVIQIIGKLRVFNDEKYISPEILKTIDSKWITVRTKELKPQIIETKEVVKETPADEEVVEPIEEGGVLPSQKIAKIIKELDKGDGVLIEEVIEKSSIDQTEKIIEKMLENGDIFQNHPGKVKVL